MLAIPIGSVVVDEEALAREFVLDDHFLDIDEGTTLQYTIIGNSNESLITATIVDGKLTISFAPNLNGEGVVTAGAHST